MNHKGHEESINHKGHEDHKGKVPNSPLPPAVERVVREIIGAAIAVHRALGPGFIEPVYARALAIELRCRGLRLSEEHVVEIRYRGELAGRHRLDLVVNDVVVVEVKAVKKLRPLHQAQILSYLKAGGCRVGLLMNFNETTLVRGLQRLVR